MSGSGAGVAGKTLKNVAKGDSAPAAVLKAGVESVKDTGLKGVSSIKDKVSEAVGGDKGEKGKGLKFTNIVEELDLPVPRAVAYQEWTPDLTRMLINLEYHPQGLFERTGNLWRAQGRRVRLELKFFRRYLTSEVLLRQDEVEGWSGEIHDGEVTEQSSESDDSGSDDQRSEQKPPRGSASAGNSGADAKRSNTTASKVPAKKSSAGASSSSRSRSTPQKSTPSKSSSSRSGTTAKKAQSGSAASSRG